MLFFGLSISLGRVQVKLGQIILGIPVWFETAGIGPNGICHENRPPPPLSQLSKNMGKGTLLDIHFVVKHRSFYLTLY